MNPALFLAGFFAGILFMVFLRSTPRVASDKVVSATMEKVQGTYDYLITIKYESGKVNQYRGDCTVWHSYPDGRRCGTMTESWLCDIWQREKWKMEKT